MKLDGATNKLVYDSSLWTDQNTLNPTLPDLDLKEAKLASFWSVPFTELRVGMTVTEPKDTVWLKVPYVATSLRDVLLDGAFKTWSPPLGRKAWKSLLKNATLQANCNLEGFNVAPTQLPWARVRIGLIANEQTDCTSPDSRIGFGQAGSVCGINGNQSVGNGAGCGGDLGDYNVTAYGFIFAR